MNRPAKAMLIGCGSVSALAAALVVAFCVSVISQPESGVKLTNEMDQYALDYIAEHGMLAPEEEVLAYYDATLSMDGTEAAIVTDRHVMYHSDGKTFSIPLAEIQTIRHRRETLTGDVIEVEGGTGQVMKIEIAPLNGGETFRNVLENARTRAQTQREGG